MLIDKPEWISHGDGVAPIFSVDVHPDGQRLATAGGDGAPDGGGGGGGWPLPWPSYAAFSPPAHGASGARSM